MNYIDTPSFYTDKEYFNKYLGCTSYYIGLQHIVSKLISLINPKNVLELGCALGTTSIKLAEQYKNIEFEGSDIRADIVEQANSLALNIENLKFTCEDMCNAVKNKNISQYDLIFLLYSFHHIVDPVGNKIVFLKNCYNNMKSGSYLLIAETFLPEETHGLSNDNSIRKLFEQRAEEGYASTYWNALNSLSSEGIKLAESIANISKSEETEAGKHVFNREDEYLIKFSWLKEVAEQCGFKVVIAENVNCILEKVMLLQKD